MADEKTISQDEIEKLLNEGPKAAASPAAGSSAPAQSPPASPSAAAEKSSAMPAVVDAGPEKPPAHEGMAEKDIEYLLNQAEKALESIGSAAHNEFPQGVSEFRLQELSGAGASTEVATLDLVRDVELNLKIELGRTHMYLEDVLKLRKGSVVPLDKLAGDPVDIYVNGRLVARGEVLVLNDNFCIRVAELIAGANVFD
jgi:flagellar motor switch protein FliN